MARSTTDRSTDDRTAFWDAARLTRPARRHRNRPARRPARWTLLALGLLAVALLLDVAWSGWTAYRGLTAARAAMTDGVGQLAAGDPLAAGAAFADAATGAAAATEALDHPGPRLLRGLPWIGDDVNAVRELGTTAELTGRAGEHLADAAILSGYGRDHLPGFAVGGRIDLAPIERAEPAIADASRLLAAAVAHLRELPTGGLLPPVADAVAQARRELIPRVAFARRAALAARLLPGFLGGEGPRSYLLVTLQPSDPRGAGGYPGMVGMVRVDGHRIRLGKLRTVGEVPSVPPVDAPAEVGRRYGPRGALRIFADTTYSPDFPTDARLMLGIWSAAGGEPVDGVIAGDASLLADVLRATGPVTIAAWDEPITADNAERILGRDTYLTRSQPAANRMQTEVGTALWTRILTTPWASEPMLAALGDAVGTRHLQVYSSISDEQAAIADLDLDGGVTFPDAPEPLVVFQGLTPNRAGYFATYRTGTEVRETPEGTEVTVTVRMRNGAPVDGPPSQLLGLRGDGPIGQFAVELDLYLPVGARVLKSSVDGTPGLQIVDHEFGRPVVVQYLLANPGETSVATIRYLVPDGA